MIKMPTATETSKVIHRILPLNEEMIADERERFSPAEHVQNKLLRMLPANLMPISTMHTSRPVRRFASKA